MTAYSANLESKIAKQRAEIARLTRDNEQLRADLRNLTFDLNKLRAADRMRREAATERGL